MAKIEIYLLQPHDVEAKQQDLLMPESAWKFILY